MKRKKLKKSGLEMLLDHKKVTYVALSAERRAAEQLAWRRTFATKLYEQCGIWVRNDFDWDAMYDVIPCLAHDDARAAYLALDVAPFLLLPHMDQGTAYLCEAKRYPDFHGKGFDVYVCAPDMSWTMVFPHEGYGPYFTTPAMARGE